MRANFIKIQAPAIATSPMAPPDETLYGLSGEERRRVECVLTLARDLGTIGHVLNENGPLARLDSEVLTARAHALGFLRASCLKATMLVFDERRRQVALKEAGKFHTTCADIEQPNALAFQVLAEEIGELTQELDAGGAPARFYTELVQVAAVLDAWCDKLAKIAARAHEAL